MQSELVRLASPAQSGSKNCSLSGGTRVERPIPSNLNGRFTNWFFAKRKQAKW
jgi:hypothetical protein